MWQAFALRVTTTLPVGTPPRRSHTCVQEASCFSNITKCKELTQPFNHTLGPPNYYSEREGQLVALAQYYGYTLYSHRNFLFASLLHGVPQREQMSECEWLSTLHRDGLHLSPVGMKLFAREFARARQGLGRGVPSSCGSCARVALTSAAGAPCWRRLHAAHAGGGRAFLAGRAARLGATARRRQDARAPTRRAVPHRARDPRDEVRLTQCVRHV